MGRRRQAGASDCGRLPRLTISLVSAYTLRQLTCFLRKGRPWISTNHPRHHQLGRRNAPAFPCSSEGPNLPVIAQSHGARNVPSHFILYKTRGESPRLFDLPPVRPYPAVVRQPPERRFELAGTRTAYAEIEKGLLAPDGPARKFQPWSDKIAQLRSYFVTSIMITCAPFQLACG